VLAGDYNIISTDLYVYAPERWVDDALFRPEVRDARYGSNISMTTVAERLLSAQGRQPTRDKDGRLSNAQRLFVDRNEIGGWTRSIGLKLCFGNWRSPE
jgi:hypothetical protein